MDIDLLAKMVGELIVRHDQVGLPGVGTFVAEMVPASFSNKGFTINPPYRRLSFYPSNLEDTLLIDFYAASNHIDREAAKIYITQYLAELKSVLEQRKTITLPGLGRLRATRENHLFFVADEELDIFPAGIGLRPVSLKSHELEEDPVVIRVPLPVRAAEVQPVVIQEASPVVIPAEEPEPGATGDEEPAEQREEIPGQARNRRSEREQKEPDLSAEPQGGKQPQAVNDAPEGTEHQPEEQPEETPAVIPAQEPEPAAAGDEEPAPHHLKPEDVPHWLKADWEQAAGDSQRQEQEGLPGWVLILIALAVLTVLFLGGFVLFAHFAPDIVDSILYTPDELRIIKY